MQKYDANFILYSLCYGQYRHERGQKHMCGWLKDIAYSFAMGTWPSAGVLLIVAGGIAYNGRLYAETRIFFKACHEIIGVDVTELWCDSYDLNDPKEEVLIPADVWPYEYDGHPQGGVRLNLNYEL